jgi:hypothetical protein
MRSRIYVALALSASALGFFSRPSEGAEGASRPFLLGGDAPASAPLAAVDPRLPSGEIRLPWSETLLPSGEAGLQGERGHGPLAQSARFHIAVQGASPEARRRALGLLEQARERVWLASGELLAGDGSLLWVLDETRPSPEVHRNFAPSLHFDRATTTCRGGSLTPLSAEACAISAAALARAPSTAQTLLGGLVRASAIEHAGPREEDASWLEQLNRDPEAPLLTRVPAPNRVEGSALFFGYLGEQGTGSALETGLLALGLSATQTPPLALRYLAEPDLCDVVRHSLGNSRENTARFFSTLAEERFLGQSGRLVGGLSSAPARVAWQVAFGTLPRHLVLPRELGPTGSVALRLEIDKNPVPIAFRIYCEQPVSTVWTVLRLGDNEQFLGRVPIPFQETGHTFGQRVHPEGAEALLLVGTNLGGVDLDHPYDPDHAPHEAHLCSIALSAMPEESSAP